MSGIFCTVVAATQIRTIFLILYALVVVATVVLIIHELRDPVKALSWIMVITLVPVAGLIFYVVFGRNYRKGKIFDRKDMENLKALEKVCRDQLRDLGAPDAELMKPVEANKNIITLLLNNNNALLTTRNKVKILNDGKTKFDEMFEAITAARSSIHIEYYIFENDGIGNRMLDLLEEKVNEGVEVRLIYDDVGSWGFKRRHARRLRRRGIQVGCFLPVAFPWLTSKINNRNHRKIVVVDGKVGFTGGINVADRYINGTDFGPWRDTHLKIEGDAVNMLQSVFVTDWYFVSGHELLADEKYFSKSRIRTCSPMQIASSGPDSDWASIMQAFFAAINKASKSIYISTPYFLPNQAILTALKVAALSGIDVRIVLPNRSDSKIVAWASRSYIGELLDAGIKVYFFCGGFNHSKVLIVDDTFCSVGSANMDMRSFEDNFEVSAIIYDPNIARKLTDAFMRDIDNSVQVTAESWQNRSNLIAVCESLARLLSPLL